METEQRTQEFTVTFGQSVGTVLIDCQKLIHDASAWVEGLSWMSDPMPEDTTEALKELEKRREQVREMELSFHRNLTRLIGMAASYGGMKLSWDGKHDLFFQTSSGFHGALIFHPIYEGFVESAKRVATPVGTWSIHT